MNIFFAAYSYIAAVVGAGFASGQEIVSFFVVHGKNGIFAIALACILFALYAYVILEANRQNNTDSYAELLQKVVSDKWRKLFSAVTFVFLCAVYSAMVACIGEMIRLLFGVDPVWGRLILSFVCCIVIICGKEASLMTNAILGIIIAIGMISCTLYMLRFREHQTFFASVRSGVSAMAYSGYNLLGAGVVVSGFGKKIKSKSESIATGIVSGIIFFCMMAPVWALLSLYYKYISLGEIPMLTMALRQNEFVTGIYSVILVLAVLTTAVASGLGICDVAKKKIPTAKCAILLMVCGMCISTMGFSHIINTVYRICGYIGAGVNLAVVFSCIQKTKKNTEKQRITEY